MPVTHSEKDLKSLSLTVTAELAAPVASVWKVWQDPRLLERWWGPPTWPATFTQYDFRAGGEVSYYMTGPKGEKSGGWWTLTAIDEHERIEFDDGFSDDKGARNAEMPTMHVVVTFEQAGGKTRMITKTVFHSVEDLEKILGMGMEEGMRSAMGQIDGLLAG